MYMVLGILERDRHTVYGFLPVGQVRPFQIHGMLTSRLLPVA